jgi:hypothetical protein
VCEGEITVTDPTHPLFGRVLKLAGLAYLPGHVRHCQVEILPDQFCYIPVASTDLAAVPHPLPTLLTVAAVEELVTTFQAMGVAKRRPHANHSQSGNLDASTQQRARGRRRGRRTHSHGGGGQ